MAPPAALLCLITKVGKFLTEQASTDPLTQGSDGNRNHSVGCPQSQALQRELDVVRKQGETSNLRAKNQMIALELRCGALESESEGLNGERE